MKTASSRASRLHSEDRNAEISTTKSRFDERSDFSARIVSLPFIRNHGFARNDTKGAVFRAFPAFSKPFHGMPKKKTVNLRLKNAVLCFGVVSVNKLAVSVKAFSLTTAREILGDEKISIITFATYPLTSFLSTNEFFSDSTALQHRLNEKLFCPLVIYPQKPLTTPLSSYTQS